LICDHAKSHWKHISNSFTKMHLLPLNLVYKRNGTSKREELQVSQILVPGRKNFKDLCNNMSNLKIQLHH